MGGVFSPYTPASTATHRLLQVIGLSLLEIEHQLLALAVAVVQAVHAWGAQKSELISCIAIHCNSTQFKGPAVTRQVI